MPNWGDVLREIRQEENKGLQQQQRGADHQKQAFDRVRWKYLSNFSELTGRNVITYYSGWLQKTKSSLFSTIQDGDKNGFMNAVHNLDRNKGLDLILHTPGGDLAATESIVHYLKSMFGCNIRAFIPQLAMSGGTMMACACYEIWMGKQSNIGPIDPQIMGVPAQGALNEFNQAIDEINKDPSTIPLWKERVKIYPIAFLGQCEQAISMSKTMCKNWLQEAMFKDDEGKEATIDNIVENLSDPNETKTHARHIHIENAKEYGLKIKEFESDDEIQDIVLTIHHAYMHTFASSNTYKIIENQDGKASVISMRSK